MASKDFFGWGVVMANGVMKPCACLITPLRVRTPDDHCAMASIAMSMRTSSPT